MVHYYEEKHFVEDISLYFEQMGLPRMAGRVLGVLLICDPPAQSLTDLCEILQASKSSVSTTTRLLTEMGLIERVASPVPRQVFFQFRAGGWVVFIRQRLKLWASLHQIAEHGLELLLISPHERVCELLAILANNHSTPYIFCLCLPAI